MDGGLLCVECLGHLPQHVLQFRHLADSVCWRWCAHYGLDIVCSGQEGGDAVVGLSLHSDSLRCLFGVTFLRARKKAEALRCKGSSRDQLHDANPVSTYRIWKP